MAYTKPLELNVEKKFEICEVRWTINHFSLVSLGLRWLVRTPEFLVRGKHVTRWQMGLSRASGPGLPRDCVAFRLKRCDAEGVGPDSVHAEWRLTVVTARKGRGAVFEGSGDFARGEEFREDLAEVISTPEAARSLDADEATVRCILIVYDEDEDSDDVRTPDEGKSQLAVDLTSMFSEGYLCDLLLRSSDGEQVMAHKAILSARLECLHHLLESASTELVDGRPVDAVELPRVEGAALRSVLEYLYSGDLQSMLGPPTLALLDAAEVLDVYHLRRLFAAREISFRTVLRVRESVVTWMIAGFPSEIQSMSSPDLPEEEEGIFWRIHIFCGAGHNRDYFSLFLERLGVGQVGPACAEFELSDDSGYPLVTRRVRCTGELAVDRLILRGALRNMLGGAPLRLTMRLLRPACAPQSYLERRERTVFSNVPRVDPLDLLSLCMSDLLETADFSDALLRCGDTFFPVHRCLLGFRCDHLRNLINDAVDASDVSFVDGVSSHVLHLLLNYLYRGILVGAEDRREVVRLKEAADSFRLQTLAEMCDSVLLNGDS